MQKYNGLLIVVSFLTLVAVFVIDADGKVVPTKRLLIKSLTEGVEVQLHDRTAVLKYADGSIQELPFLTNENLGKSEELSVSSSNDLGGPEHYLITRKVNQTEIVISLGQPLKQQLKVTVHYTQPDGDEWKFHSYSITRLCETPEQFMHYVYVDSDHWNAVIDLRKRAQSIAYMKAIEAQESSQK